MADYGQMSDAELLALVQPPAAPARDYAAMSDAELLKMVQPPSVAADVAKSGGIGLVKGAIGLAGALGDLTDLGAKGIGAASDFISDKLGVERYKRSEKPSILNNIPTSETITKAIEEKTGKFYEPQTTPGKYARTVGEFIPASALGPGGMAAKLGTGVTAALGSEGAGQLTEGTAAEPYARVAGALAGGIAPMAAARAVTPLPATAQRQRLVDILQDEGVTSLTAGQRTGNKALQFGEDMLGNAPGAGQSAANIRQRGQEQFTEAAMRRAGSGPEATPEVLAANNKRISDQFNDLSARNPLAADATVVRDISAVSNRYGNVLDSMQKPIFERSVDSIFQKMLQPGGMTGAEYQIARSDLGTMGNALMPNNPQAGRAFKGLRDALDKAMERGIAKNGNPDDIQLWRDSRREWGAQKTIEKTASRAGEATAEGQLVPANLRNTVSAENRGAYARGEGQFSELARAGAGVMAPLPNSGTAQRLNATNIAMLPVTATIGRALMSRPVQSYLGNQALTRQLENLPANRLAIARALLAQERQQSLGGPAN